MSIALLVVVALYGYASGSWGVASFVGLAIVASFATRKRLSLASGGQRVVLGVAAGVGVLLGLARTPEPGYGMGTLPGLASAVAMAALAAATSRVWTRSADRSFLQMTFALGVVGVAACGATRLGPVYATLAIAFFVASLAALRAADPARARWAEQSRRQRFAAAGVVVGAVAVGAGIAYELPLLYDYTQSYFDSKYEVIGFKSEFRLGALEDLKKSDEIVLRVSGPRTDYLRGAVYDRFEPRTSSWGLTHAEMRVVVLPSSRPARENGVEIRRVGGWGERYFVPMRAGSLGSSAGEALIDPMGVMRPAPGKRYERYWFDANAPDALHVAEPTPDDTRVPATLRAALEKILGEWTDPTDAPDVVLAKIARHFDEDYEYSLSFTRPANDPILDFLLVNKQGHCEYFASAMTLLARAAKIPARVAAGYRVAERNPLTGQYIVRQKNAHSWVEAWVPGFGWRTFDPTPASKVEENLARDASMARALTDVAAAAWSTFVDWYTRLTVTELAIAAAALIALFAVLRFLRLRRRGLARTTATGTSADDRPLPCLAHLLDSLATRGIARAPSEPLERFAFRLLDAELREPADLIARYAALRYGGLGDAAAIARAMDRCAAQLGPGVARRAR